MKKVKLLMVLLILVLVSTNLVYAFDFQDMDDHGWALKAVKELSSQGFIQGYENGLFKPANPLSRAELVIIINRMNAFTQKTEMPFIDVSDMHWAYDQIAIAYHQGYINGFPDKTFRPNDPVTREQFAMILNNLYDLKEINEDIILKDFDQIATW